MTDDPTHQRIYWNATNGIIVSLGAKGWAAMRIVDGGPQLSLLDELPAGINYLAIGWATEVVCPPGKSPA